MKQHLANARAAAQGQDPAHGAVLHVVQGDMWLRGMGYIGETLVSGLFNDFAGPKNASEHELEAAHEELRQAAHDFTKLPIASIHSTYMPDIFETTIGKSYREQLTFDLCDDGTSLTFTVPDGPTRKHYEVETLQVTITRFGSLAFEAVCSVRPPEKEDDLDAAQADTSSQEDADGVSVSHIRIMESMIGPHSGRFPIDWVGAKDLAQDLAKDLDRVTGKAPPAHVRGHLSAQPRMGQQTSTGGHAPGSGSHASRAR